MPNVKDKFVILGGQKLNGTVSSSGAKNAALKMIASTVLTDETVTLHNVPNIGDVRVMLEILESMQAKIEWLNKNSLNINCGQLNPEQIDQKKVGNLRGSVVLIGPLLARYKKIRIHEPGGCSIGARPITTTVHALNKLGVKAVKEGKYYSFEVDRLLGQRIVLDEISVTTTETLLMTACLANGLTEIRLCACEPEIGNLIDLLVRMGAKITGKDTSNLIVEGVNKLHGAEESVIPDRIEIGTFACALAALGKGTITNVIPNHLDNLLNKFDRMNILYQFEETIHDGNSINDLTILASPNIKSISFDTRPYPGFSTDLQSTMVVLLTQSQGKSRVFETLFEGRLEYTQILKKMGAGIDIVDDRTVNIIGPSPLKGAIIESPDLRAGAAFVLAGLIAQGETQVHKAHIIDRGYEQFCEKLAGLGAKIERV